MLTIVDIAEPATPEQLSALKELLDKYLIGDLETMAGLEKDSGGLGYPMLQTILGGMEFIGMLISDKKDGLAFEAFWNELAGDLPIYEGARKAFRAIRNSSAHFYLVHTGVSVTKDGVNHLTQTEEGFLSIDLVCFYRDFLTTYGRLMSDLLGDPRRALGYSRVSRELTKSQEIKRFAATLNTANPRLGVHHGPSGTPDPGKPSPGSATSVPSVTNSAAFVTQADLGHGHL